jgi:arylsulfatase A-like enzyme
VAARHARAFDAVAPWRPPSFDEADVSDEPSYISRRGPIDPALVGDVRRRQLATLRAVDEAVAAILRKLRELGVADDTLVVFTSANGCAWGEHRIIAKNRPYEEQIRVPDLVRYPRLVPLARRDARLATSLDFVPTFLELAGADVPPGVAGAAWCRSSTAPRERGARSSSRRPGPTASNG